MNRPGVRTITSRQWLGELIAGCQKLVVEQELGGMLTGLRSVITTIPSDINRHEQLIVRSVLLQMIATTAQRSSDPVVTSLARPLLTFLGIGHAHSLKKEMEAFVDECDRIISRISAGPGTSSVARHHTDRACVFISNNYSDANLTLSLVARRLRLSPFYLSRTMKKTAGVGFGAFLNGVRVSVAEKLLTDSSLSIKEISASVGYNNTRQLDRHFKKIHRTRPTTFRIRAGLNVTSHV